jgi:hypothetical protein
MEEECTSTEILVSYLRAGSKIISLLKEDASWMIPIMWDNLKQSKMASLSKMAMEHATSATVQSTVEAGKMT